LLNRDEIFVQNTTTAGDTLPLMIPASYSAFTYSYGVRPCSKEIPEEHQ